MVSKDQLQTIETETRRFFEKLSGEDVRVEIKSEDSTVAISLTAADPQPLIGEQGQTLAEIQHLLRLMLRKKIPEPFYLSLDVNEYQKTKEEYLRDLAKTTADEVVLLKKEKELPPMPASARRIIHMALAERSDVNSESVGEGVERRIVIRLKTRESEG